MHRIMTAGLTCLALALGGGATAQTAATKPISVARIVSSIPEGTTWGRVETTWTCLPLYSEPLAWGVGIGRLNTRAFEQPVRAKLKAAGYKVSGDDSDPFDQTAQAELAIGGTITAIKGDFCEGTLIDSTSVKGEASIEVDWQIYSNIERRVLATVHARGSAKSGEATGGGFQKILINALDDSLQGLIKADSFKALVAAEAAGASPFAGQASKAPIALSGALAAKPMTIPDAVGSVVLILSGGGHGSGFLVSSDGYVMTAEHVVGADKYVKIRWSDGLEGVGEVVGSDKRRDVALIRVDPRGRQPLALHRSAPQPGDTVFAIGAPLDLKNQSTVTRGVASANRIMDGFSFIQSDVTISPGNSGGPLLDEKGQVLGICDLSYRPSGGDIPTGINYFVPIDDALRFLAAEPR